MRRFPRHRLVVTAALALAATVTAAPLASAAVVDPAPIGPNQYFAGLVNGDTGTATIEMVCPGPIVPGETGHPLEGQTVSALPVTGSAASDVGFTGSAADSIAVSFGTASTTTPLVLSEWNVAADIPTSLNLPCQGTGTVVFTPNPGSATARAATVAVTFENIAAGPSLASGGQAPAPR